MSSELAVRPTVLAAGARLSRQRSIPRSSGDLDLLAPTAKEVVGKGHEEAWCPSARQL